MNGPQHYTEAEKLLAAATAALDEIGRMAQVAVVASDVEHATEYMARTMTPVIAAAQAHATLALAAATARPHFPPARDGERIVGEREAWDRAIR